MGEEVQRQGEFPNVVLVSMSDFGRTLSFNGEGTDHGWGGNSFVLGGEVDGGRIINEYLPSFAEGSRWDGDRGRIIPQYPWESVLAPVAEWMGVPSDRLSEIFVNYPNFEPEVLNVKADIFK